MKQNKVKKSLYPLFILSNLLLPEGFYKDRQQVNFTFIVYKCKYLFSRSNTTNTYVQIQFAGNKVALIIL